VGWNLEARNVRCRADAGRFSCPDALDLLAEGVERVELVQRRLGARPSGYFAICTASIKYRSPRGEASVLSTTSFMCWLRRSTVSLITSSVSLAALAASAEKLLGPDE
jgi:hypothetical protein